MFSQAIKHEKLNQPQSPCEPSSDYNLAQCVEEYVIGQVGCQPPWRRFNVEGMKLCDNWTLLNEYSNENIRVYFDMNIGEIIEATKCRLPCSYIEYKVSVHTMCWRQTSKV